MYVHRSLCIILHASHFKQGGYNIRTCYMYMLYVLCMCILGTQEIIISRQHILYVRTHVRMYAQLTFTVVASD